MKQTSDLNNIGSSSSVILGAMAVGAGLMYYLDPQRGARRRSLVRDKFIHAGHKGAVNLRKTGQFMRDWSMGRIAETRSYFSQDDVNDPKLCARIRSAIGRAVSHPHSIQVAAVDGCVALCGPVLRDEVNHLISAVRSVRGVKEIENQLEIHSHPGDIPALQGHPIRRARRGGIFEENWSPATRILAATGGAALCTFGLIRGGLLAIPAIGAGGAFLTRALTNLETRRLTGIGAGRCAVSVQKTTNIRAPIDRVFEFFSNYQNFPSFMSNIREVRDHGNGRSHWVVAGPLGIHVAWDSDITQFIPNRVIAWRSVEGSMVENAGIIRFDPAQNGGGTRVDIKLSYNPPGGAIGHVVAKVFGADPKSEMDSDLMRAKTALETGHAPHDAARPVAHAEALH